MSHDAQVAFCLEVKRTMPLKFVETTALDVGSLDVNGTNKWMFKHCHTDYIGIDLVAGKNVRLVTRVQDVDGEFGVVISTEALEHDPDWQQTLLAMSERVKSGGLLIITCGGPGRQEHGTRAFPIEGMDNDTDYYGNVSPTDVLCTLPLSQYEDYCVQYRADPGDTYFWGVKK